MTVRQVEGGFVMADSYPNDGEPIWKDVAESVISDLEQAREAARTDALDEVLARLTETYQWFAEEADEQDTLKGLKLAIEEVQRLA